jgi:uracil phosphoribosyltransferase
LAARFDNVSPCSIIVRLTESIPAMPRVHVSSHPLVAHHVLTLRDPGTRPAEFRRTIGRITRLLAVEATVNVSTGEVRVTTPLGEASGRCIADRIAIVPILRAGLGMADGLLDMIPDAEVWHIGVSRDEVTLAPHEYYTKLPKATSASLAIVVDPMLATGGSAVRTCEMLRAAGVPRILFLAIIAAPEGIARLSAAMPDITIHVAAVDERVGLHHSGARGRRRPAVRHGGDVLTAPRAGS